MIFEFARLCVVMLMFLFHHHSGVWIYVYGIVIAFYIFWLLVVGKVGDVLFYIVGREEVSSR